MMQTCPSLSLPHLVQRTSEKSWTPTRLVSKLATLTFASTATGSFVLKHPCKSTRTNTREKKCSHALIATNLSTHVVILLFISEYITMNASLAARIATERLFRKVTCSPIHVSTPKRSPSHANSATLPSPNKATSSHIFGSTLRKNHSVVKYAQNPFRKLET